VEEKAEFVTPHAKRKFNLVSDAYSIQNKGGIYYLTLTVISWIDVFTRKRYCDIILDSLTYCRQHKGLQLHAWIIMSNHVHLIASTADDEQLSNVLRDFKKHTSKSIIDSITNDTGESRKEWMLNLFAFAGARNKANTTYQVGQNGNHAVALFSPAVFKQKIDYLHNNPIRNGLVSKPEDYLYSSAKDYLGEKGLIEIDPVILKEYVR
jgi:putative transposase